MTPLSVSSASARPPTAASRLREHLVDTFSAAGWLPFLLWAGYSAWIFLHVGALVHDEIDFLTLARDIGWRQFLSNAPPALYGSLFWVGLKLSGGALGARVVVLATLLATPYLMLRTVASPRLKVAVLMLWLSFPIAWWTGKLIAPEIPSMLLIALALYWLHRGRMMSGALALGAAVGIKISALPAVLFFGMVILLQSGMTMRARLSMLVKAAAAFVLAVGIACPPIFEIVRELRNQPGHLTTAGLIDQAQQSLLIDRWEWDAVFSGGVLRFSLMPFPLLIVAGVALLRDWRILFAAAVTACLYLVMSINSASFYGWYSITLFPIMLYTASRDGGKPAAAWVPVALCLAAAINFAQQVGNIGAQAYQKFEQIRVLEHRDEIQACLRERLAQLKPDSVLDLSEFGLNVASEAPHVFAGPGPEADAAAVHLIGTRMLVGRRQPNTEWPGPKHFYASCDAVMIFTRN